MKAYKIEVLIIDHDELGEEGILDEMENVNYANDCISLNIKSIESRDIGEWHDDHPLNKHETADAEYQRIFNKSPTPE